MSDRDHQVCTSARTGPTLSTVAAMTGNVSPHIPGLILLLFAAGVVLVWISAGCTDRPGSPAGTSATGQQAAQSGTDTMQYVLFQNSSLDPGNGYLVGPFLVLDGGSSGLPDVDWDNAYGPHFFITAGAAEVPILSGWGTMLLIALLAGAAVVVLRFSPLS